MNSSRSKAAVWDQSSAWSFLRKQHRAGLLFAALVIAVTFGLSSCEYPGYGGYYGGVRETYTYGPYGPYGYGGYGLGYDAYGGYGYGSGIIIGGSRHGVGFGGHHSIGRGFEHGGSGDGRHGGSGHGGR